MTSHSYSRIPGIIETEVSGHLVLLHPVQWQYYEFDAVGRAIWMLLETPRSLDLLVDDLMDSFTVAPEQCLQDTKSFLDGLIAQGLVAVHEQ